MSTTPSPSSVIPLAEPSSLSSTYSPPSEISSQRKQDVTDPQRFPLPFSRCTSSSNSQFCEDRVGQGCFLCLESPNHGAFAVLVPCFRPTTTEQEVVVRFLGSERVIYKEIQPWESACEPDGSIWERLVATCYEHKGAWKKWVPFYGITEVKEVEFRFLGVSDPGKTYPIRTLQGTREQRKNRCKQFIAGSNLPDFDEEPWLEDEWLDCKGILPKNTSYYPHWYWAENERRRLGKLEIDFRPLSKRFALNPWSANGHCTLEGYDQETPIYHLKGPWKANIPQSSQECFNAPPFRGLCFALGWQKDRLTRILPLHISCVWLGIAVIWLSVIVWKVETGTWELAFGFGQVIAASLALLISAVRL